MSARMDRCASRMQPVWTCLEATAASVNLDIASPPLDSVWVSLRLWSAMAFKEVKGVSSTQIIQYIIGVVNGCHCSLNQQGFSQLLMTSVEIIQNWWKHGAGLEKRLEEAAKKTAVFLEDEADFSVSSCGLMLSRLLKLLHQTQSYETLWTAHPCQR